MNIQIKLNNFIDKIVGEKLFKLYQNYKGIKTITTITLVPFALILGRKAFKNFIKYEMNENQENKEKNFTLLELDNLIDDKYPIKHNDNTEFGKYLKLFGISKIDVKPTTLLPLGILMSIYNLMIDNKEKYLKNKQSGGNIFNNLKQKVSNIVDNRVFDIYLKYLAITSLNSSTLVPLALLFGTKAFKYYITDDIKKNKTFFQYGGVKLPKNIPFLDDKLLGTYLKIIGLSVFDLSMNTLLPLGLLIALYDLYIKE